MSLKGIKELGKDSLVYGLGSIATRAVGFLLIPVYTAYLSPADYGILALVNMWGGLLGILIGLGQHSAVFRFYFKDKGAIGTADQVLSTFLALVLAMAVPCLVLVLFSRALAELLLGEASLYLMIAMIIGIHWLDLLRKVSLVIIRARRWTARYSLFTVASTLLTITLIIVFVVGRRWGAHGVLSGQILSGVLATAILSLIFLRSVKVRFHPRVLRDLLRFGLPLVPGQLLYFAFRFSNRYFLDLFSSVREVGLFSLGDRFAMIIVLLNTALQTAWPVFLYGNEKKPDAPHLYARAMTYYLLVAGSAGVALTLLTPEIFAIMVNERFHDGQVVVPVLVVTYILMGVHLFGSVGINLREKTYYFIATSAVAAVVSIGLNILLIPRHGIYGAAVATLCAYAAQAVLTLTIARRLYPVRYEWRRIGTLLVAFAAVVALAHLLPLEGLAASLALKLGLLLVGMPVLLLLLPFFDREEKARLRSLVSRSRRRG